MNQFFFEKEDFQKRLNLRLYFWIPYQWGNPLKYVIFLLTLKVLRRVLNIKK